MSAWKPGDVALLGMGPGGSVPVIAIRKSGGCWDDGSELIHDDFPHWVRPLVVIDPESDADVKRLCDAYRSADLSIGMATLQAALREFAQPTPPKPEEPLGLGAVVEDGKGAFWVRLSDNFWRSGIGIAAITSNEWDRIDAVTVLSEGVRDV